MLTDEVLNELKKEMKEEVKNEVYAALVPILKDIKDTLDTHSSYFHTLLVNHNYKESSMGLHIQKQNPLLNDNAAEDSPELPRA